MIGRKVYATATNGSEFVVHLPADIAHGTYLLQVHTLKGTALRRVELE
jgi:hypothetical protein